MVVCRVGMVPIRGGRSVGCSVGWVVFCGPVCPGSWVLLGPGRLVWHVRLRMAGVAFVVGAVSYTYLTLPTKMLLYM